MEQLMRHLDHQHNVITQYMHTNHAVLVCINIEFMWSAMQWELVPRGPHLYPRCAPNCNATLVWLQWCVKIMCLR